MNLEQAIKEVGHSCQEREFLMVAEKLGFDLTRDEWTQGQVDAIRAARTFAPSIAGRQIGLSRAEFLAEASKLGLTEPWTQEKIHAVRFSITPPFPGLTSDQVAARLGVKVDFVRRYAQDPPIGEFIERGCYVVDGERRRFTGLTKCFQESDIPLLRAVIPETAKMHQVEVSHKLYQAAVAEARNRDGVAAPDILSEWLRVGGRHAVPQ